VPLVVGRAKRHVAATCDGGAARDFQFGWSSTLTTRHSERVIQWGVFAAAFVVLALSLLMGLWWTSASAALTGLAMLLAIRQKRAARASAVD
jgi:amino acid transporter